MKTLAALLLLASCALAQNNSGTLVIAPVRPQSASDTFPSAIANEIQGGPFSVSNVTAMSNIPSARLVPGALAYVTNDARFRLWTGTNWINDFSTNLGISNQTVGAVPQYFNVWLTNTNTNTFSTNVAAARNSEIVVDAVGLSNISTFAFQLPRYFSGAQHYDRTRLRVFGPSVNNATNVSIVVRQFEYPLNTDNTNTTIVYSNTFTGTNVNFDRTFVLSPVTAVGGVWVDYYSQVTRDIIPTSNSAVSYSGLNNNGNFTNENGTIYGFKTNSGPFEGVGNFFASNNTTLSNETLFRVGLSEATNRSAQFGFRVVRTNNGGEGLAVFSVFGYNALMMIGPSDRSRTNTATNAAIEADIWTINQANRVMTLRDTNTGALTLHQDLGFATTLTNNAPSNSTTPVAWMRVWVGTNSYRMPLYQ